MPTKLFLETPLDPMDTYRLAETTDLLYRKLRNIGYARRHADSVLPDEYTALQSAAVKIIKLAPPDMHPVRFINKRNLAVLRVGTMSPKMAICTGSEGRIYSARRGHLFEDGKFIPTAEALKAGFMLFASKKAVQLTRIAIIRPPLAYMH